MINSQLWHKQKTISLKKKKTFRFGSTWGKVNDYMIVLFWGWVGPLTDNSVNCVIATCILSRKTAWFSASSDTAFGY